RRRRRGDLLGAGDPPRHRPADHQPREPGRGLRPGLRAQRGAPGQGRRGRVQRLRLRRHQRHPGVRPHLTVAAPAPAGTVQRMLQPLALPSCFDLLALRRQAPSRYPLLLDSVASGTVQGRWDLLLVADGRGLRLEADGVSRDLGGAAHAGSFLQALDAWWQRERDDSSDPRWPFLGGWALLLDYELAAQVEPVLRLPRREDGRPPALALRCPAAVLHDRASGECVAVAEPGQERLLERVRADIEACGTLAPLPAW